MRLIYRLHRWISAVCAFFFLLLVLTGLPLLFNGDIARWNALEKRPAFGETSSRVLWAEAAKGLERIERENPGRRVQSISAYPERGLLVYRFSRALAADTACLRSPTRRSRTRLCLGGAAASNRPRSLPSWPGCITCICASPWGRAA